MSKYLIAIFLACGGLALIRNQVKAFVARMFALLVPFAIASLHRLMLGVLSHPAARQVLVKNADFAIELLDQIAKGFEELLDAAEKEIDSDIKKAAEDDAASTAKPVPAPEKES